MLSANLELSKLIRLESISHLSPESSYMFKLSYSKISLKTTTDLQRTAAIFLKNCVMRKTKIFNIKDLKK